MQVSFPIARTSCVIHLTDAEAEHVCQALMFFATSQELSAKTREAVHTCIELCGLLKAASLSGTSENFKGDVLRVRGRDD